MKIKLLKTTIVFLLMFTSSFVLAQKIKIKLHQPPPNMLGVGDMWNLTLENTTKSDLKIYLTGTATEEKDGLIIEGKSKVFTVKPGKTNYKYNDFSGAEVKYNNGKYKEVILRTGNAPEGSYTICVTAFEESGEVAGMENCIMQTVQQLGSISLISPEDGAELNPEQPLIFTWTPLPKGGPYSLKIVELKGNESPENAIKSSNVVVAGSNSISGGLYQVPTGEARNFVPGKKYAWQVTRGEIESEVWTCRMMSSQYQIIVDTVIIKCDTLTFNPNKFFYQVKIRNNNTPGTSGPTNTAKAYITSTNPTATSIIPDLYTPITILYNNTGIISGSINFLIAPSSIQFVAKMEDNVQPEVYNATAPYTISLPVCSISKGKCDCGRIDFQNNKIMYTSSGELRTVSIQCDATYRVDPGSMVLFSPAFTCGGNCQARYEYTVNGVPKGIQASPYAIGPVNFLTNVKIRYWCGDNVCDSCNVILDTLSKKELGDCGCNIGGLVFVNYNNSSETYPCPCGATINVNSNTLISFTPKNPCSGDSLCFKGSSYQISDSNYIVVGQSQTNILPMGSFSYKFLNGNYTVKIKSICGNDTCECTIYIASGKSDCNCGRWENNNSGIGYTTKPPIPDINRVPKSNNKKENEDIRKLKIIPDTGIVNSNQKTNSLNCNDTISNFEINTEFRFTSATYLCSSSGCTPQYNWTIKHPAPSNLVQTVNVKSFITTLSESGIYTITRQIVCGGKICDECVFFVNAGDVNSGHNTGNCSCGGWQRDKILRYSDTTKSYEKKIGCFLKETYGPVKPGLPMTFQAQYSCIPNCPTKYSWKLINLSWPGTTTEAFADNITSMPVEFTPTSSNSNYKFVLYTICGNKICDSCGFNFKTMDIETCNCGRWFSRTMTAIQNSDTLYNDYIKCGDTITINKLNTTVNLISSYSCAFPCKSKHLFDWISPTNQINSSGILETGDYTFNLTSQGLYKINIYEFCESKKCDSCKFFISVDTNPWQKIKDFLGDERSNAVGFSIGNYGYVGTGRSNDGFKKDFWQYDPITNIWTQKADFGGVKRASAVGFVIGNYGYIGTGYNSTSILKDFWQYDPSINTWTQKADFGGMKRFDAVGFTIGNKGYIGTGQSGGGFLKDFWEYDPSINTWIQKADFGGVKRASAVGFVIGNYGYIGTGSSYGYDFTMRDFWKYDPSTDIWNSIASLASEDYSTLEAVGFSIGNFGYVGGGYDDSYSVKYAFWKYNPLTNSWVMIPNCEGGSTGSAVGFTIGNYGYVLRGFHSDFWKYTP